MTSWASALALPVLCRLTETEVAVRTTSELTSVLVWVMNVDHQAFPDRSAVPPSWRESDKSAWGGTAVATAVALNTNCGCELLPVFIMKLLRSTTAAALAESLTWTLLCDWAVKVVEATVATYCCPWYVTLAESTLILKAS